MKYTTRIHIPTTRPFSKECALKQLEYMKKRYNVLWSEWLYSDLIVEFEIEVEAEIEE